jgi:hypothetical protein
MPQPRKPARLLLREDNGRKVWIIRDNGRSFRTGFSEDEENFAKERLEQYLAGEYTPASAKFAHVYYITAANSDDYPVKIGFTSFSMTQRLSQLQAGNPNILACLATEVGSQDLERERHARFRNLHIRGEWFRRDARLMEFIRMIQPQEIYA